MQHLINSGSDSVALMERWIAKSAALLQRKSEYENLLQRELSDIDEEYETLSFLAQELQIRISKKRYQKCA